MEHFFQLILMAIKAMTILEVLAVMLAIAYIVLAVKENIWCWVAGFCSTLIYLYLFFNSQLYSESLLQLFYLAMSVYGWVSWQRIDHSNFQHGKQNHARKIVRQLPLSMHIKIILIGSLSALLLGSLMQHFFHAALAYIDAATTIFAIISTYLVTQKIIENWLYWIAIDALSIYMYIVKGFYLTSLLFGLYIVLSITGYYAWKKHLRSI